MKIQILAPAHPHETAVRELTKKISKHLKNRIKRNLINGNYVMS